MTHPPPATTSGSTIDGAAAAAIDDYSANDDDNDDGVFRQWMTTPFANHKDEEVDDTIHDDEMAKRDVEVVISMPDHAAAIIGTGAASRSDQGQHSSDEQLAAMGDPLLQDKPAAKRLREDSTEEAD